jgi:ABC-type multidrug transport system fused ATPase/permease subunit
MQLLLRFYDVVSGEIFLDGINILEYDIVYLRGYFGVVSQEPVVFHGTIAENIRYNQDSMTFEQIRRYAE